MKKKTSWVKVVAILTAVIGVAIAVAGFLRKKSKKLGEELDFDNSLYFDDVDEEYNDETEAEADFSELEEMIDAEENAEKAE